MRIAVKDQQIVVKAWQLGAGSSMEKLLVAEGRIVPIEDGKYEIFSQEATGKIGEIALEGDYFKVDHAGFPYPNTKRFFEANHDHIGGDDYLQIPRPLRVWFLGDPEDEVIHFMRAHKGLRIEPSDPDASFFAPLWGTLLVAKRDAVIVIYEVVRDLQGCITDVDFNFVAREEFEQTYRSIELDDG